MSKPNDGGRERSFSTASEHQSANSTDSSMLTLLAEELAVTKEAVETGRVRVSKHTQTREVSIDEDLVSESAEIETIPIGRQIFEAPKVRQEGDTIIIPVVEEILHIERRLILKEEVRITRRKTTEQFHDRVFLRHQEAVVTRVQVESEMGDDSAPTKESQ